MKTKAQVKPAARMAHRAGFTFSAKPVVQPQSNTAERTVSEPALYNAPQVGHAFGAFDIHHAATPTLQPKLKVGPVNDHYEQEANRVAQQVVGQINQPAMQRQEMPDEEEELQTKPVADSIQRQDELEEEEVQTEPQLQRRADGRMAAPPAVEGAIHQARGSGQALSDATRQPMERAFGADFSHVKVHTDAQADQLNRSMQARAFTTGPDIFFRQGEHSPGTRAGQELLAHELTHVVQQGGERRPQRKPTGQLLSELTPSILDNASYRLRTLRKTADGDEELRKSTVPTFTSVLTKGVEGEEELQKGAPPGQQANEHGTSCGCARCRASVQRRADGKTDIQRSVDVSVVEHSTDGTAQNMDAVAYGLRVKPSVSVRSGAPPSQALGGNYGLTWEENVQATISAKKVGANWFPVVKSLRGNYSMQTTLLAGQSEITGPGGNTTRANYLAQIKNLALIGEDVGNPWYMLKAVVKHEKVHAKHFKPALKKATAAISASLEAISIADTGQTKKQAVADLKADGAYQAALVAARGLWVAENNTLLAGDHAPGGPTEKAERTVVDPMRKQICAHAKKKKWPASPHC